MAGVNLEIADAVKAIPIEKKAWSVEVQPGTSLYAVLKEDLLKPSPGLHVDFPFDKTLLTTKAAAARPAVEDGTPPGGQSAAEAAPRTAE